MENLLLFYVLQKDHSKKCKIVFKRKSTIWNWNLQNSKSIVAASNLLVKLAFFSILLHGSNYICNSPAKYNVNINFYYI